jgi:hypothetical protein
MATWSLASAVNSVPSDSVPACAHESLRRAWVLDWIRLGLAPTWLCVRMRCVRPTWTRRRASCEGFALASRCLATCCKRCTCCNAAQYLRYSVHHTGGMCSTAQPVATQHSRALAIRRPTETPQCTPQCTSSDCVASPLCSWYLKAAESGDARAQNNLGWMYQHGQGVPTDFAKAVHW